MRIEFDGGAYTRLRCAGDALAIAKVVVGAEEEETKESVRGGRVMKKDFTAY
jgi:hypothetical protein